MNSLDQEILHNMQAKETEELLVIWETNDRGVWSDEAFSIVHDILVERLGNVPQQKMKTTNRRHYRSKKTRINKLSKKSLLFSPIILFGISLLLIPILHPTPNDTWFSILFLLSFGLSFSGAGVFLGFKAWSDGTKTKLAIKNNLPKVKKTWGPFFPFFTSFLPDRLLPGYFLWANRITSISLILLGILISLSIFRLF
jgi:hypothetical protein